MGTVLELGEINFCTLNRTHNQINLSKLKKVQ